MKKQKTNRKTTAYLFQVAGRTKWAIAILMLSQMLVSAAGVCYALALRDVINGAVAGDQTAFFTGVVRFAVLVCFQIVAILGNRFLAEHIRSSVENRCKQRLFEALLYRDYGQVTHIHTGEWMNRLTGDTAIVVDGLVGILPGFLGTVVKLLGALGVILALEPRFLYLLVPGGILLVGFSVGLRGKTKRLHKGVQEADGSVRSLLQELLGSLMVVRSYGAEQLVLNRAWEKMRIHKGTRMRRSAFSNVCNLGLSMAMNGAYVLGALFCGYGILTGSMTYGTFTAVLQLIGQVQEPFSSIGSFLPRWYGMLASVERLLEAEDFPLPEEEECDQTAFTAFGIEDGCFRYLPLEGTGAPVVLNHVQLRIRKGSCVALTGPSGGGKSTILKLLLGLYRLDSGVCYGEIDGLLQPLADRKLFAYVPQGNHLLSGTIRDAVAFSQKTVNDEELWQALQTACADGFVKELERGLDAPLGERGAGLSEGQLQRLAIARAICSGRPVLLLDEATSALDENTERQLLQNLQNLPDRTVLIVTHRPAALEICDEVVEVNDRGCRVRWKKTEQSE